MPNEREVVVNELRDAANDLRQLDVASGVIQFPRLQNDQHFQTMLAIKSGQSCTPEQLGALVYYIADMLEE